MKRRLSALACFAVTAVACRAEFTSPPAPREDETAIAPCGAIAAPLRIEPASATVAEGALLALRGSGGTGRHRWRLRDGSSGAIDPGSGLYVAGPPTAEDRPDVVVLEDRGCRGSDTARIEVVAAARILPRRVALQPGDSVTFHALGGSGSYAFALGTNGSGGGVSGEGTYTAGPELGRDVVRLTDEVLGTSADAVVEVVADAGPRVRPSAWFVPVGAAVDLPVEGGGSYELTVDGDAFAHEGGATVRAMRPGSASAVIRDPFSGTSTTLSLVALAPLSASRSQPPDHAGTHVVAGAADLGGDGRVEVAVGAMDDSVTWNGSGRVVVYGDVGGELQPVWERAGGARDEELGSAVALGDVDADGLVDLVVGARRASPISREVGAVYVYSGVEGELLGEEPTLRFFGVNGFDRFGEAVAICDFNADGLQDLAVGAPFGEDADGARDQGVVHVFLARPGGRFSSAADEQLVGRVPTGGGWGAVANLRLGDHLAAGDFDGDGACDLAASARSPSGDQLDSGAVGIFRGVAATYEMDAEGALALVSRGGVAPTPSLWLGRADGADDGGRFGQSLALGDVDGDSRADLLVGRRDHDGAAGDGTGAIYLFRGRALEGPASAVTDISSADWSVEGEAYDRVGHSVALQDLNGDGLADVVSGDYRAERADSELGRPGVVRVYLGASGSPATAPDRAYEGPSAQARFGVGVGSAGDVDGDGEADLLAFAPYHDSSESLDDDRGGLFLATSTGGAPRELPLERPASGQRVGESLAWLDLDRDGRPELAVGSTGTDVPGVGSEVGAVRIHRGTAAGVAAEPIQELGGYHIHSNRDELGRALASAGDLDGDGHADLAVLAASEDLPSAGLDPEAFDVDASCDQGRDNPGVVFVFRGLGDGTLEPRPAFAFFGPEAGAGRDGALAGGFDLNGDGLDDVALGGRERDGGGSNAGGVEVFFGRAAASDGRTVAVCAGDVSVPGDEPDARFGHALAAAGDLDADGCDELAVGAPEADPGEVRDAGALTVLFGFGEPGLCAADSLRRAVLRGADRDAEAGSSVAGGVDVDGDGVPDLVVGAPEFRDGRGEVGRVYFVSGAYAVARIGSFGPLVQPSLATPFVDGRGPGELLGTSVALTAWSGAGMAWLGGPFGDSTGRANTGGAVGVAVGAGGFGPIAFQISGESSGQGLLGASVAGFGRAGGAHVAVGAPGSNAAAVDDGAVYALTVSE